MNGLRPLADRKNLRVEVEVTRMTLNVDRGRFRQILYNLISNAIKYTPDAGSIRVVVSVSGTIDCKGRLRVLLDPVTAKGTFSAEP